MCGIAGILLNQSQTRESLTQIASEMIAPIKKRGPDATGLMVNNENTLIMCHTRLSIVDTSATGSQPMRSHDGRYTIVFNGEIYNYLEIRRQIESANPHISWRGSSDTEVLLELIATRGLEEALNRCDGMFAFAIWDEYLKKLCLARDRFGQKPLYWGIQKIDNQEKTESLLFSSDLASIKAACGANLKLRTNLNEEYLYHGYLPCPLTPYEDIFKMVPGQYLCLSQGVEKNTLTERVNIHVWFDLEAERIQAIGSHDEEYPLEFFVDGLRSTLTRSIANHIPKEVPSGCFLSGGVDSSLVAAIMQSVSPSCISTITASFASLESTDIAVDESDYAQQISRYLNTRHTNLRVEPTDLLSLVTDLPSIFSEPFADQSQIPTALIAKLARQMGLKVMLTGDGADEIYGGYNRYRAIAALSRITPRLRGFASSLSALKPTERLTTLFGISELHHKKLFTAMQAVGSVSDLYLDSRHASSNAYMQDLNTGMNYSTESQRLKTLFARLESLETLEQLMAADMATYMHDDVLTKVDRCSMHFGLETRAPYLSSSVVYNAWQIPTQFKSKSILSSKYSKYILRCALSKYLPLKYLNPKKTGFAIPIASWLRGPLRDWAYDLIMSNRGHHHKYALKALDDHCANLVDNSEILWRLLVLEAWRSQAI